MPQYLTQRIIPASKICQTFIHQFFRIVFKVFTASVYINSVRPVKRGFEQIALFMI